MLSSMVKQGFRLLHVRDDLVQNDLIHGLLPGSHLDWTTKPRPSFEEITAANLQYDGVDAENLARLSLGCPKPAELTQK